MKTQASEQAFDNIKPKLNKFQDIVYKQIKYFPNIDIYEISRTTGLPEKTISGRLTELQDKAMIRVTCKKDGLSCFVINKPNYFDVQLRKVEKFKSKMAQLEKNYPELLSEYINKKTKNI
ncbi:hypothetical protein GW932_05410 [archaeon]|nr:hypothetical protein [archaeon]